MIHDVLNIALGVAIAQLFRPLFLAAVHIVEMKIRGNYYRTEGVPLLEDWLRTAKGLY